MLARKVITTALTRGLKAFTNQPSQFFKNSSSFTTKASNPVLFPNIKSSQVTTTILQLPRNLFFSTSATHDASRFHLSQSDALKKHLQSLKTMADFTDIQVLHKGRFDHEDCRLLGFNAHPCNQTSPFGKWILLYSDRARQFPDILREQMEKAGATHLALFRPSNYATIGWKVEVTHKNGTKLIGWAVDSEQMETHPNSEFTLAETSPKPK